MGIFVNGLVPDCLGKVCEEAWQCQWRYLDSEHIDFEVLYLRWRDETVWHSIFFDYGPLFWGAKDRDPFKAYQIDHGTLRSQADENGKWHQMIELTGKVDVRGLSLRSIRGGSLGWRDFVVLTFGSGAPEKDVHLAVTQVGGIDNRTISQVGRCVGLLPLSLDQALVAIDEAA